MKRSKKFKKGAASFYIVAISTLILVIIATSFAAVIISEVTRTSNDDLAQSAYDSALAGVEDAKLAYYNYLNCVNGAEYVDNSKFSCSEIKRKVENNEGDCDMVADILGRYRVDGVGVPIQESDSKDNNMQQYYTCVKITNKTKDVLGGISESNSEYSVRVKFDGVSNKEIKSVRISWHSDKDGDKSEFKPANYTEDNEGLFNEEKTTPAVIALGMIQTSEKFSLSDFEKTVGDRTDRGTIYLVPDIDGCTGDKCYSEDDRFVYIKKGSKISAESGFLKSNDKLFSNLPFLVECDIYEDYACRVDVEIPKPIGGERNEDTFIFSVSLPYGGPSTHFSLEFFCGGKCPVDTKIDQVAGEETSYSMIDPETGEEIEYSNQAILDNVQVSIDSTGRANDLYRRVETRLESNDVAYPIPSYAVQAFGSGSGNEMTINKNFFTTCEWNFYHTCNDA